MLVTKLVPIRQVVTQTPGRALIHIDIRSSDQSRAHQKKRPAAIDQSKGFKPDLAVRYFEKFPNYCRMIEQAKECAKRSILIDNCGFDHIDLRHGFDSIDRVYTIEKESRRGLSKLTLIEFKNQEAADRVAASARHNEGLLPIPLKVMRYNGKSCPNARSQNLPFPVKHSVISYKRELMPSISSYDDLISHNMMSLVAFKVRFVTLVNLESVLCSGMFVAYELMPFGSSVIDLGTDSGDLDLILTQRLNHQEYIRKSLGEVNDLNLSRLASNLVHLDKSLFSENRDRGGQKSIMKWFDFVLKEYMPLTDGFSVLSVRHAKVPIIKFTAGVTSIDCDLAFNPGLDHREDDVLTTNYSGILMSQILYSLCRNNKLFTYVSIYLRVFGKLTSITSKEPNIGMTNFQYLSLIMFYLQRVSIEKSTESSDKDENTRSGWNVVFLNQRSSSNPSPRAVMPAFKDLLDLNFKMPPVFDLRDNLESLLDEVLTGFFQFYSVFDFSKNALNLYEGKIEKKLDNSPLYIWNPLDKSRNICHNVSGSGLDHFVKQARAALRGIKASDSENPLTLIKFLLLKSAQQQHQQQPQQQSRKLRLLTFDGQNYGYQAGVGLSSESVAEDVCR